MTHLLLTIDYGGRMVRVSDTGLDIADAATGTQLAYGAGLDSLTVSLTLSFLAAGGSLSVPVQCVLPVDVALSESLGHRLAGSAAEIALWTEGDDYAARTVLAVGVVSDPQWGEDGEAVTFAVQAPATVATALAIPVTSRVDGTTTATILDLDPADLGQSYPLVFGRPGGATGTEWVSGSQVVWIAYGTSGVDFVAILAGHASKQTYVQLVSDTSPTGRLYAVHQTVDYRGQPITVIAKYANYPTLNIYTDANGNQVYGILYDGWTNPALGAPKPVFVNWARTPAGGESDTGGLSPLAPDVVTYMLVRAGVSVDLGRFAAALPLLSGYRFDCVIDDGACKALEWLQTAIYPLLPISIVSGPDGDYPIVWRYDATSSDATLVLDADADPSISRAGAAKTTQGDIANSFTLKYNYSVRTGSYTATLTRDASNCPYCAASVRRWGTIARSISTVVVYDAPTAGLILAWMAHAYTSPTVRVPYLVPSSYKAQRGQVVTLTDSRMSYARRICLVADVQIDGSGIDAVDLLFIADALRDR